MSDVRQNARPEESSPTSPVIVVVAWLLVLVPLGYGFLETVLKAVKLFTG